MTMPSSTEPSCCRRSRQSNGWRPRAGCSRRVHARGLAPRWHPRLFCGMSRFAIPRPMRTFFVTSISTSPREKSATLVGMNGAGKTTLVRLMCGLYRPTRGIVLIDGVDLRELDLDRWHADVAAMFQEFVRLPVSVAENVGVGAIELLDDAEAITDALDEAGALVFSTALRDGLQTKLMTPYAEGTDVSGGQWQRLGIARSLLSLRGGARFLVLDEPTSNLDTASEERLVQRLLDDTRGSCTSLLVTHRLALARRTDRIFVVEAGRIIEQGTHAELIGLGGRYATAFEMQASLYPLEEASDE